MASPSFTAKRMDARWSARFLVAFAYRNPCPPDSHPRPLRLLLFGTLFPSVAYRLPKCGHPLFPSPKSSYIVSRSSALRGHPSAAEPVTVQAGLDTFSAFPNCIHLFQPRNEPSSAHSASRASYFDWMRGGHSRPGLHWPLRCVVCASVARGITSVLF